MSEHLSPTRSRWRQALHNWVTRHQAAQAHYTLRQRNIYVLPSAAGCVLALTLLVLLIASINFQLNLGFALTFLIAGSALASLWMGHRNMRGITLRLGTLQPVFQEQRATVPVLLHSTPERGDRHGLSLAMNRTKGQLAWVHTDIPREQTATVELGSVPHQRGWHRVPRIVIESRFPLGVFRLWSYWQPDGRVLVYPPPEPHAPPLRGADMEESTLHNATSLSSSEPDGVRSYQRGDTLRSVVWKKAAKTFAAGSGDLVVRSTLAASSTSLWLDARATGLSDPEAQIARLTAWVLTAHEQHLQWGLHLPSGHRIPPATGTAHLQHCLTALAVDGLPHADFEVKSQQNA